MEEVREYTSLSDILVRSPQKKEHLIDNPLYELWKCSNRADNELRIKLADCYSWAVPSETALRAIVACSPIVEIGAGSGYWAHLISQYGGDILAFDKHLPLENEAYPFQKEWFPIEIGGPEKAKEHNKRSLFLCWPPIDHPFAYECLKEYKGEIFIYVGTKRGFYTGDDRFFDKIASEWKAIEKMAIPRWHGIFDSLSIYVRR